jgi:hypothetical protein
MAKKSCLELPVALRHSYAKGFYVKEASLLSRMNSGMGVLNSCHTGLRILAMQEADFQRVIWKKEADLEDVGS